MKARENNRDKFYKTNLEDQETQIQFDYKERALSVYTSRKSVYERIKKRIGEPTGIYYTQEQISGAIWVIPFSEKQKITSILSRPLLIGQIE